MSFEIGVLDKTFKAAASLTTKQFYFVKLTAADTVNVCAATTDMPIGVLQNAPASGGAAVVRLLGISKVSADTTWSQGAAIGTSADGQGVTKTTGTHYVMGTALEASTAANELVPCLITGPRMLS